VNKESVAIQHTTFYGESPHSIYNQTVMQRAEITGSFLIMFLYDVADEIRLPELRTILKAPPAGREPPFRQPAPQYVQFASPPVVEPAQGLQFAGDRICGSVAYYDYGVVSLKLEIPFEGTWNDLIDLSARWMNAPELEQKAAESIRAHLGLARPALVNPYSELLSEDYYVIYLRTVLDDEHKPATAEYLIHRCGDFIAQAVRGERASFSQAERAEILESRMSYYTTDLLVVGWTAAFVYDTPEGAAPTIQLLEYANTQLLEFRHYDAVLTRLLAEVYRKLEKRTGLLARWRLASEAERVNTIRLEVRELTEHVDNSIKFLSDMFAARLYRIAAAKIGVPDYKSLVLQKLDSAGELYGFMMDNFYHGRTFVLELMVVVILIIELVYFFRPAK
jgi:hypothetical protein